MLSSHWQTHAERGNLFSLWLIRTIANYLGRRVARLFLLPITGYYLLTAKTHCRSSKNYLRRILNREPGWWDVARHIHCFASTIIDRIYFVTDRTDLFTIEFVGEELLSGLREQQCGCLMLGAHIGSFEALRSLGIGRQQLPLHVLMYPDQNALITRLIAELNPEIAESIIPLGAFDALIRVKDVIGQGGMVGILGDRTAENDKSVRCTMLNGDVTIPLGPAIFAEVLDTPVILCLALFMGGNHYRIVLETMPPMARGSRAQRHQRAIEWANVYINRLEYHLKSAPYNWFNFYDFWGDEKT